MVVEKRKEKDKERESINSKVLWPLEVAASHNFRWQCIPAVIAALGE